MGNTHVLESFKASISTQGKDKHIHLPRKMYKELKDDGLLNKKFVISISLTELEE